MRILYVLKHNPWGVGGGCYACRNYLQLFAEVFEDAEIDVCVCQEYLTKEREKEYPRLHFIAITPRGLIGKVMSMFTGIMHRHQAIVQTLLASQHYDFCIFDHNSIAGTLVDKCQEYGVRTIVLNHNCEFEYFRDNNGILKRFLFLHQVKRCERNSYKKCSYNIFLTEEDKVQFEQMYGASPTKSIVGGCFYPKHYGLTIDAKVKPLRKEHMKIVISGTMGNVQNLDGIYYFLNDLLQYVPNDMQVVMAGKNPPASLVQRLKRIAPHVILIPNPKNMDEIVKSCDIFICPARLGGGMKLRVMDGLRNGLPVLVHAISARGYREFERKGMMWEFETPEDFGHALKIVQTMIMSETITRDNIMAEAIQVFAFEHKLNKFRSQLTIVK